MKLFHRIFILFLLLGISPILVISIWFALPLHLQLYQYQWVVGIMLVVATIFTLCLCGIVTRILKRPINMMLDAQKRVALGDVSVRLREDVKSEISEVFDGFNRMVEEVGKSQEKERLYAEQRSLTKLAMQVSHDLRSPLSSLHTVSECLARLSVDHPDWPQYLELLQLSSKRLLRIADDLLEKGKAHKEVSTHFLLQQMLDELVGEFEGQQGNAEITFVKRYHPSQIALPGSPNALQRALGNLIKNAMESIKGRGRIEIESALAGEEILLIIRDDGCGMDAETLRKVRAGGHTQGKSDGHGIGLDVVRKAASEWKGSFDFESEPGKGSKALFRFPKPAGICTITQTLKVGKDRTVAVIDDDPSMRKRWEILLRERQCRVLSFDSYEELTRSPSSPATTAIVDFQFSNSSKNGWDVITWLKKNGTSHLYLCTSDYWRSSIQKQASELGVPLLPKPLPEIQVESIQM